MLFSSHQAFKAAMGIGFEAQPKADFERQIAKKICAAQLHEERAAGQADANAEPSFIKRSIQMAAGDSADALLDKVKRRGRHRAVGLGGGSLPGAPPDVASAAGGEL